MKEVEEGFNLTPLALNLLQSVPIWLILSGSFHFWMKRREKLDREAQRTKESSDDKLQKTLEELAFSIRDMNKFIQHLDRRLDATDLAISMIVKDSFSSNLIARGTGGWPKDLQARLWREPNGNS